MTYPPQQRALAQTPRGREAIEQLRRMVRLLESAEVLMHHARRTRDAAQAAVLRRRAERRMKDAAQLRAQMGDGRPRSRPRAAGRQALQT
jgi:hypothetical protein